ncbi:MAG: hypothetical protein IJ021_05690, partial [Clostridia bacterium]|nr:hypothetical protein [Clostridia bacterium]
IKSFHDDKYDKTSFIKNILLDNILPSDIYLQSKELHCASDVTLVVFLLKFNTNGETSPYDIILNMFPNTNQDYVISMGENDVVLVRELKPATVDLHETEKIAITIADTIASDFFTKVSIGIGTPVTNIKDVLSYLSSWKLLILLKEIASIIANLSAITSSPSTNTMYSGWESEAMVR